MKKIIAILLLVTCLLLALTACGGDKTPATENPGNSDSPASSGEQKNNDTPSAGNTLTVCDVDYFSPCRSSEYLSFVPYNADRAVASVMADSTAYSNIVVATVRVGQNDLFQDGFRIAYNETDSESYTLAVGTEEWLVLSDSSVVDLTASSYARFSKPTGEYSDHPVLGRVYKVQSVKSPMVTALEKPESIKEPQPGYFTFGENWCYYVPSGGIPESVSELRVKFDDMNNGETLYTNMFFPEEVAYNDEVLEAAIAAGVYENSYTALKTTDDLTSVLKTIGDAPKNLEETIFYPDLIADHVSKLYGLNLRNKNFYVRTGSTVRYMGERNDVYYDAQIYPYQVKDSEALKATCVDSFSYTDSEGTNFAYYFEEAVNSTYSYYAFRDDLAVAKINITYHGDTTPARFEALNGIWGIRK